MIEMATGVIDPNEILQNFGVWGVFIFALAVFVYNASKILVSWVQSGANQANAITNMAVSATMRANELADVRFVQAQKIADLEKRLAVIEPIVKRVPKLEEDYAEAIKSLAEALDREKTKDLLIEQLELKIEKLEEKVGRYEGADEITGDDTRPLIVAGDILGDGTSGRDSGSRSRDGDDSSSD